MAHHLVGFAYKISLTAWGTSLPPLIQAAGNVNKTDPTNTSSNVNKTDQLMQATGNMNKTD